MERIVEVEIPVAMWREDDVVVIHSPAFELASQGGSQEEAMKNFQEAVSLFIETIQERHVLRDTLIELGWKQTKSTWVPGSQPLPGSQTVRAKIPFENRAN